MSADRARTRMHFRYLALGLLSLLSLTGHASRAATPLELSVGGEYSSLKLSDGSTSTIWYAPFSARVGVGNWTVRATVPYVSITAPQDLILLIDDDPTGAAVGGNGRPRSSNSAANYRTVSGLGDSSLSLTYSFDDLAGTPLYADLGARVRLPTGDSSKGTGIGATDYGLQTELGIDLDRGGMALNGGRRYLGRVSGLDRVNGWAAGAAAWLTLGPHALIGAYYDWRMASERDLSDPREAGLYLSYRLSRAWKVRLDASHALDLPAANYTVALTVYWRVLGQRRDR